MKFLTQADSILRTKDLYTEGAKKCIHILRKKNLLKCVYIFCTPVYIHMCVYVCVCVRACY
jgi:hypothetical protein